MRREQGPRRLVPDGFSGGAYLFVENASDYMEFLKTAFGAEDVVVHFSQTFDSSLGARFAQGLLGASS